MIDIVVRYDTKKHGYVKIQHSDFLYIAEKPSYWHWNDNTDSKIRVPITN